MGEIRYARTRGGKVRALAYYRDFDGVTRQIERTGKTESQARSRLKEAGRDRGRTDVVASITPDTTVAALAEEWFTEIRAAVSAGERSPGTEQAYRDRLDNQVLPALGALRLRELSISRVDALLRRTRERHGIGVAKLTRTVLSGVLGLAARHDALRGNLVRDAAPIRGEGKVRDSLDLAQVQDLRAKLATDPKARAQDLLDLIDLLVATGLRIGEALAVRWSALDLDAGTLEVQATVVRVTGQGVRLKEKPKSKAGWRIVELPGWAVDMLHVRAATAEPNPWNVVFTSVTGKLRDPSNTQGDLREAFDRAGYEHITSHTLRRTVATLMDEAGLSARAAADQLGHAKVSMTTDHYFGRRARSTGAAAVLDAVGTTQQQSQSHG
jgi:integrase